MANFRKALLFYVSPCLTAAASAGGSVVKEGNELALKLPNDYAFAERSASLVDVQVDNVQVPLPEEAQDMAIVMSVDEKQQLRLHAGDLPKQQGWTPLAWAEYKNTVKQNGWGYLNVKATDDAAVSDDLKMYAAGYLEGFASGKQIRDFQHNANGLMAKDEENHNAIDNIRGLFSREIETIRSKANMAGKDTVLSNKNQPKEKWWRHSKYMMLQAWGIMDAYNAYVDSMDGKPMSMVDLLVLNSDGETPELEMAYDSQEVMLRESERDGITDDSDDSSDSKKSKGKSFLQRKRAAQRHRAARKRRHGWQGMLAPGQDLMSKARERRHRKLMGWNEKAWRKFKAKYGRCSALVRLNSNHSDIFVGHTTFSDYSEMNRIFKYYDFPLAEGATRRMGMSSYPGVVGSTDDYYIMDTGVVVTETTVSMLSDEAFDKLDDNGTQVPDYMRIMIANRLAHTGEEWVDLMKKSATGTYNSQWMVVDYKKFTPGQKLLNGTFFVLEQGPGVSHSEDMTHVLETTGFWASENRAFFDDVRNVSGETDAEEIHGNAFSKDQNPRAHIFEGTAPKVQTLADMRHEMQRNKWPHEIDGGEANTPDHAIAARSDLDKYSPHPNGGVDSKVTNACLAKKLAADAINGPTHDGLKPFRWTDAKSGKELFPDYPHAGLPDEWNFDWVRFTPSGEQKVVADDCAVA